MATDPSSVRAVGKSINSSDDKSRGSNGGKREMHDDGDVERELHSK
jgi:hypothetical protein